MEDKPILVEVFTDNGEHSHWTLINPVDGVKLWSEDEKECEVIGYPVSKKTESNEGEKGICEMYIGELNKNGCRCTVCGKEEWQHK